MTSAQHPAILFKLPFHPSPPLLFFFFFSFSVIKSNRDDTSHLFHPSFVLHFLLWRRRRGEQSEVDLRVYISAVPPPYCGIDVALWGPGTEERHRKVDAGGKKLNKMSFHSAQQSQGSTGRHFVPPSELFSAQHLMGLDYLRVKRD